MPWWQQRPTRVGPSDVSGVLQFPGGLPQMVVVVAWQVDDLVREHRGGVVAKIYETVEDHRRYVVQGERQFEYVAVKDEGWGFRGSGCRDQVLQTFDQSLQHWARRVGVNCCAASGDVAEQTVFCPEVSIGQAHPSDLRHQPLSLLRGPPWTAGTTGSYGRAG